MLPFPTKLTIIQFTLCLLLRCTTGWVLPFFASDTPSSLEEQDRWLSTPSEVIHRNFLPTPSPPAIDKGKEARILILTPLKDASLHLRHHFALLSNLTYPHHLIDLGFIIGDTVDDTRSILDAEIVKVESGKQDKIFNSCTIVLKDLGNMASQEVAARHGFAAQIDRRKKIAIVRNTLLQKTLGPEHEWVYWRDVDVAESPNQILEDFIAHDKDVLVPNVWFRRQQKGNLLEGGYDYNSWQETPQSEAFKKSLDTEIIVFEGYSQFQTHRRHMAKLGDWRNNAALEIPLDGVGGVSLLVRAEVHRKGILAMPLAHVFYLPFPILVTDGPGIDFPIKPVDHQIETEGLAKMARIAGYEVYGLPNYVVWHFDTSEKEGNLHETPVWLWPLLVCTAVVATVLGLRYREQMLYTMPVLRGLKNDRSAKVRQY